MYNPIRGGTRGGQGDFAWAQVSADKDRENYLGHSINAPTGRWQKNKDVHWYTRDEEQSEKDRREEIRRIKEAEEDALSIALGFKPAARADPSSSTSGANAIPVVPQPGTSTEVTGEEEKAAAKEEKRRLKAAKREEKEARRARKAERRSERAERRDGDDHRRRRSRTRSPVRSQSPDHDRYRHSRSDSRRDGYDGRRRSISPPSHPRDDNPSRHRTRSRSPPARREPRHDDWSHDRYDPDAKPDVRHHARQPNDDGHPRESYKADARR